MSQQYPIEQISFNFDKILQEVEQGEPIQISWQGKQVAVMLSASEYERLLTKQVGFWESVQQFRQAYEVEKVDIDPDLVFADVRDKSTTEINKQGQIERAFPNLGRENDFAGFQNISRDVALQRLY